MSNCKARQYSDQMLCACGLAWDVNDPEPPECPAYGVQDVRDSAPPMPAVKPARVDEKTDRHVRNAGTGRQAFDRLRAELDGVELPDVLFDGYRVLQALDDKAKRRTGPENVSDVLDAVVRIMREEKGQQ